MPKLFLRSFQEREKEENFSINWFKLFDDQ